MLSGARRLAHGVVIAQAGARGRGPRSLDPLPSRPDFEMEAMITAFCTATLARSLALSALTLTQAAPQWQPTFVGGERLDGAVYELLRDDSGAGPLLYAGGAFTAAGGRECNHIARWNGSSWRPLGRGTDGTVHSMAFYDDGLGGGRKLFVGGDFDHAGTVAAANIACWDGQAWSSVGWGIQGDVNALEVFDDGSGPALYAAGWFYDASGVDVSNVAKWNGHGWEPVGDHLSGICLDFEVFDDGEGPGLYVSGNFIFESHPSVNGVARLRQDRWSAVGTSLSGGVRQLETFDDGSGKGPQLYAVGSMGSFPWAPRPFKALARFDGPDWVPLGEGVAGTTFFSVAAAQAFDDGSGSRLYFAGTFNEAGGQAVNRIVSWDGANYQPLGPGISAEGACLEVFPGPSGVPSLFVGGEFKTSGAGDAFLACWGQ